MPTLIRQAKPTDLDAIVQVHVGSWRETYRGIMPNEILDNLNAEGRRRYWEGRLQNQKATNFVAEVDGQVVGFACCGPNRETLKDYDAEVYAIYLMAAHHSKGLGKGLWQSCTDVLKSQSFQKVVVWVLKDNPSKQFYIRGGGQWEAEDTFNLGKHELVHEAYGWEL